MLDFFGKIAFLILFFASAIAITWFTSKGWRALAKGYPATDSFSGTRWFFRSGGLAGSEYGCVLIVGGDLRGAYFSAFIPSKFCPPLFIPWEDIKGTERKGVLVRFVELRFAKVQGQQDEDNWISGRMADNLEALSNGRWKYQRERKRGVLEDKVL
jgi:hypothetical protein